MKRQKMKKKGFTLVELLVVIAIIAMLLAILMPALGKVRQLAQRLMCGTNLAGIGKAMLTYATDDKYESFPVAGSPGAKWDRGTGGSEGLNTFDWRVTKFTELNTTSPKVTLSAHLYLLVKFADVSVEQFVCPGSDQKKFELNKYDLTTGVPTSQPTPSITDVWDFGSRDRQKITGARGKGHQSYSYQSPVLFSGTTSGNVAAFPISSSSNPAKVIMADRNPFWMDPLTGVPAGTPPVLYNFDVPQNRVYPESIANGNNPNHQKDGQNVLYVDLHSKFEKSANCGLQMDNIYTYWGQSTINPAAGEEKLRQCGLGASTDAPDGSSSTMKRFEGVQSSTSGWPMNEEDTYLVSDVDKISNS